VQGVFDTLLVRHGRPVDLLAHMTRLCRSVTELYDVPVDAEGLAARLVSDVAGLETARVRTTYDPRAAAWEIDALALDPPGLDPRTLTACAVPSGLGAHKWVDRTLVSATGEAGDLLLVDEHETLLECGSASLFVVVDGVVRTAPTDGRILPGTVRARVLAHLRETGHPVSQRAATVPELVGASEVFATSSIRGIQPIVSCTGLGRWTTGPVTTRLRAELDPGLRDPEM
jgi:para-aminobenzoate synthetase/4-amino-4-deoxychorismate lyase